MYVYSIYGHSVCVCVGGLYTHTQSQTHTLVLCICDAHKADGRRGKMKCEMFGCLVCFWCWGAAQMICASVGAPTATTTTTTTTTITTKTKYS